MLSPGTVKLTWESVADKVYHILSADALTSTQWTTNATVTGLAGTTSHTNAPSTDATRFYRIVAEP